MYIQETEKQLRKKWRQGIEDADVRTKEFGRPVSSRPKDFVPCALAFECGEITSTEARKRLGACSTTFLTG